MCIYLFLTICIEVGHKVLYDDLDVLLKSKYRKHCFNVFVCTQQEMIPFAVVGSDQEYQVNGKKILGRKTKWGTIEGNTHAPTGIRVQE